MLTPWLACRMIACMTTFYFQQHLGLQHYATFLLLAVIAGSAAGVTVSRVARAMRSDRSLASGILSTLVLTVVGLAVAITVYAGSQAGHPEFGGRPAVGDSVTVVYDWCEDAADSVPCLFTDESGLRVRSEIGESLTLPACTTEDQETPCVWWASQHGNGNGQSFAVYSEGIES